MGKRYPVIGNISETRPKGCCKICGKPQADIRIDVEINYMRGDDDVYKVHKDCIFGMQHHEILHALGCIELM